MTDGPLHHRAIDVQVFDGLDGPDTLTVKGTLRDERPWIADPARRTVHDMALTLTVRTSDLVIVSADAQMGTFPHTECPLIAPAFARLVGMSVGRGFTRALKETFAGVSGCAHLYELARVIGPAVIQSRAGTAARQLAGNGRPSAHGFRNVLKGTCHIWAEGGIGEQKLAAGWVPGAVANPVPPVAFFLAPAPANPAGPPGGEHP
jgi:hypothetical protein